MSVAVQAKVFQSGNSQAVRLPKRVAFPEGVSDVVVEKTDSGALLIKPVRQFDWDDFFAAAAADPVGLVLPEDDLPDEGRQARVSQQMGEDVS